MPCPLPNFCLGSVPTRNSTSPSGPPVCCRVGKRAKHQGCRRGRSGQQALVRWTRTALQLPCTLPSACTVTTLCLLPRPNPRVLCPRRLPPRALTVNRLLLGAVPQAVQLDGTVGAVVPGVEVVTSILAASIEGGQRECRRQRSSGLAGKRGWQRAQQKQTHMHAEAALGSSLNCPLSECCKSDA